MTIAEAFTLAQQHHRTGRLADAERLYRQVLAEDPSHVQSLNMLGALAHQVGRNEAAAELIGRAVRIRPDWAEAHYNLAVVLCTLGQLDGALASCQHAITLKTDNANCYSVLGNVLREMGKSQESIAACQRAVALQPRFPEALCHLGNALKDAGRLEEAVSAYHQAIAQRPDFPQAWTNLGNALMDRGQIAGAIAAHRRAVELDPRSAEGHSNLGNALREEGQLDDAVSECERALALRPDFALACNNLANALRDQGLTGQALAAYRRAIALKPDSTMAHSNLLFAMHFDASCDAEVIAEEHRRWNRAHAAPLRRCIDPHGSPRRDGRLRIGYVSPDFRTHPVACHVLPLLQAHDRRRVEVFCYANVRQCDEVTDQFRSAADHWRDISRLGDESADRIIRDDRIDILVDLAGHTTGNRLLLFARRPAPVQVTRQGYPNTTGMSAIDFRMTDAWADPPGMTDAQNVEKLVRLPTTNWIYSPLLFGAEVSQSNDPDNGKLPDGPVVFGSFNQLAKLSGQTLSLWAQILQATPGSTLLLKDRAFRILSVRQRIADVFANAGIKSNRLEFASDYLPSSEHIALFRRSFIALDPHPYHGTATTCDALWLGVPVVTLAGRTHVSRVGVSLLNNIGHPSLIASSADEYVRIATELANDLPRLQEMRSTLREQMERSPLMDAPQFARDVESEFARMRR